ncbi:MAG: hypothetical protein KDD60_08320, partial [Bdellovibrionales bacterium]|nr:hypothetical protein [Bdellovibrionales bacterium]
KGSKASGSPESHSSSSGKGQSERFFEFEAKPPLPKGGDLSTEMSPPTTHRGDTHRRETQRGDIAMGFVTPPTSTGDQKKTGESASRLDEVNRSSSVYLIARLSAIPKSSTYQAPFLSTSPKEGQLVGIEIPQGAEKVLQRISAGTQLEYGPKDDAARLTISSLFPSPSAAKGSFSGDWYTLTPFEIMRFGNGPWRIATSKE